MIKIGYMALYIKVVDAEEAPETLRTLCLPQGWHCAVVSFFRGLAAFLIAE